MKHVEKHIGRLLFSIAITLVFGNVAFASKAIADSNRNAVISEFQNDNQKPLLFNEISVGEVSQIVSQNEYLGLGLFGTFYSNQDFSYARASSSVNASYSIKDKRKLIFRHLFPFHFFW
ncbi:MAG: hypothetical protein CL530_12760 [Aequorivita sp.]|nr:hypothetical protein [Aequorivita sp.]